MAVTKTTICNNGLGYARQDVSITSIDENSVPAKRCKRFYELNRQSLLSEFPWNFATKVVKLSQLDVVLNDGFQFSYQFPAGALRILTVATEDTIYEVTNYENKNNEWNPVLGADNKSQEIHSSIENAYALVIFNVTTETVYDPKFAEYLSYSLAVKLANLYKITDKKTLLIEFVEARDEAYAFHANQKSMKFDTTNDYVDSRNDGST